MSLFVVKHEHTAEACPSGDKEMAPMLLQILSQPNATRFGVDVKASAVLEGLHTLHLILEAGDGGKVQEFMAPFGQMGSVEIIPANPCETVVSRGRC
ncbi:MAG: sulfite oxidase [Chloroflexi bacterium]|nr:sulfite oxidase [Chloroflexota bacterium]MDA1270493.1 sulfite oxidase [Chloroflexota bacterium]